MDATIQPRFSLVPRALPPVIALIAVALLVLGTTTIIAELIRYLRFAASMNETSQLTQHMLPLLNPRSEFFLEMTTGILATVAGIALLLSAHWARVVAVIAFSAHILLFMIQTVSQIHHPQEQLLTVSSSILSTVLFLTVYGVMIILVLRQTGSAVVNSTSTLENAPAEESEKPEVQHHYNAEEDLFDMAPVVAVISRFTVIPFQAFVTDITTQGPSWEIILIGLYFCRWGIPQIYGGIVYPLNSLLQPAQHAQLLQLVHTYAPPFLLGLLQAIAGIGLLKTQEWVKGAAITALVVMAVEALTPIIHVAHDSSPAGESASLHFTMWVLWLVSSLITIYFSAVIATFLLKPAAEACVVDTCRD